MGGNSLSVELDTLELKVQSNADQAALKVDKLTSALNNLKGITKGGVGLTTVANQLSKLNGALSGLNINSKKITELKSALSGLSDVQKSTGLTSIINALKKLPQISKELSATDLSKFADQMTQVANAVRPLASEMEKVSAGFKAFPIRIQKLISSNTGLAASNKTTGNSFGFLGTGISGVIAKIGVYGYTIKRTIGSWITSYNDYVENVNLFTVAMGKFADESMKYAERVQSAAGIDLSEWIRNQSVLMDMVKGYGVVEDKAKTMSEGLTQLIYDYASFYNIGIEDSAQKVQSAIAGEIEPVRRLGKDLSVTTLQQYAYKYGIDQSVNSMTQAQKAQLRYVALMDQSKSAMGDMARTIQTPANAMRILQQQVQQLTRALGSLFIPILQVVIPWVQAFVSVLTDAVRAIAAFFNVELPEIDYSGMDSIGTSAGVATDEIEDTTGALGDAAAAAKKLKDYTLGFDELNILNPDTGTASGGIGGSGGASGGSYGGDLDLPIESYDFLGDLDTKVKSLIKSFDRWEPIIKLVGAALAAAIGFKVISKMIKGLSGLSDIIGKGGLLGGFSKLKVGVMGAVIAFTAAATEAYALTLNGMDPLAAGLLSVVTIAPLAGGALYAMIGPIGLVIGVLGSLAGAVTGVMLAQEQMKQEAATAEFFDGVGVPLSNYTDRVKALTEAFMNSNNQIINWNQEIQNNNQSMRDTWAEIDVLMTKMNLASDTITSEDIEALKSGFDSLYQNIKSNLDLSASIIITTLRGGFQTAIDQTNGDVDLLVGEVLRLKDEIGGKASELKTEMEGYMDEMSQLDPGTDRYIELRDALNEAAMKYGDLTTEVDLSQVAWDEAKKNFDVNKIDFSSVDDVNQNLEELGTTAGEAMTGISDARLAALKAVEDLALQSEAAGLEDYDPQFFSDLKDKINRQYDEQEEELQSEFKRINDEIWTSYNEQFIAASDAAMENSSGMDRFFAWVNAGFDSEKAEKNLREMAVKSTHEALSGVEDALDSFTRDLNLDPAQQAGENIPQSVALGIAENGYLVYDAAKENGNQIPAGLGDGIGESSGIATDAIFDLNRDLDAEVKSYNQIHSPSRLYENHGMNLVLGLKNGIVQTENRPINAMKNISTKLNNVFKDTNTYTNAGKNLVTALSNGISQNGNSLTIGFKNLLNTLISSMETFTNRCRTALNNMLSDFSNTMSSVKITGKNTVTYTPAYESYIPRFASGGFPTPGQLFVANEPGNPEMIGSIGGRTAVANNEQITEAIAAAVYNAVVSAQAQQADRPIQINETINLDGRAVYRNQRQVEQAQGYRMTTSTIPV